MSEKNYQKMTVQVTPEWEEIFIVHCFEQGATGIEHLFETASRITLAVYFTNMSIQMQDIFTFFQHKYMLSPEKLRLIHCKIHQCKDWLLEWQKHFHPIPINNELIVCPPWEIPKDSVFQHHLLINPGNGFGSGSHPSTILALKLLSTHIENAQAPLNSILDVGTGSGILLIASQFLGLKRLVGMDIDFPSVFDAQNNFQLNHMTGQVLSICGSPECVDSSFDIVISNMMLQELKPVRNALKKNLKKTGVLILSGFYLTQEEAVLDCFSELEKVGQKTQDEWCGLIMKNCDQSNGSARSKSGT